MVYLTAGEKGTFDSSLTPDVVRTIRQREAAAAYLSLGFPKAELADRTDSPLYLLLGLMAKASRQFFTFEQYLDRGSESRHAYFAALEMLRAHTHRVLLPVAKIADIQVPKIADHRRYDEAWQLEAYERPDAELSDERARSVTDASTGR